MFASLLVVVAVIGAGVAVLMAADRIGDRRARRNEAEAAEIDAAIAAWKAADAEFDDAWKQLTPAPVMAWTAGANGDIRVVRPVDDGDAGEPPTFEERTAKLVVDPTLSAADVTEMLHHITPGAGSVASVAATAQDTRYRTSAELAELHAAEDAAYAEAAVRADRAFFARFDAMMTVALAGFRDRTARVDAWAIYQHADNAHECEHCQRALHENSQEHKRIVSMHDTGSIPLDELNAMLAAA